MEIDEEEFIKGQRRAAAVLLSSEMKDVTSLRTSFVDWYGEDQENPVPVFYSALSIMDLQGALEIDEDYLELKGEFKPVPPGDWQEISMALGAEDVNRSREEFERHFKEHFPESLEELHGSNYRFRDAEEYSTGVEVQRELGHMEDVSHTWAEISVAVPVSYPTSRVEDLVRQDLRRYAEKLERNEYETLRQRTGEEAVS